MACIFAAPARWVRVPCYNLVVVHWSSSGVNGLSSARLWPRSLLHPAAPRALLWGGTFSPAAVYRSLLQQAALDYLACTITLARRARASIVLLAFARFLLPDSLPSVLALQLYPRALQAIGARAFASTVLFAPLLCAACCCASEAFAGRKGKSGCLHLHLRTAARRCCATSDSRTF